VDQRINDAVFLPWFGVSFFDGGGLARWRITAAMEKASITRETWRRHLCHHAIGFRVIEPEFVFRCLKTVLDRPSMGLRPFDRCCRLIPGDEESEIAVGDMTADQ
jgi:hypothetical protein